MGRRRIRTRKRCSRKTCRLTKRHRRHTRRMQKGG